MTYFISFLSGVVLTVVYNIAIAVDDLVIRYLRLGLDADDKKTLDKLVKFRVDKIITLVLVTLIFVMGILCGGYVFKWDLL